MFQTLYFVTSVTLTILYVFFMYLYTTFWKKLPVFNLNTVEEGNSDAIGKESEPTTFLSILIPARNEAENITACLSSILQSNYPKISYEIIVIDDHSDDDTPQYVRAFSLENPNVRLIELKNYLKLADNQPFKKRAIEAAIGEARGDLIVTTDGDCLVQPNWLRLFADFYAKTGKRFIAAPVNFHDEQSVFERFQSLDYIGMMGITGAGVAGRFMNMCNGANLAYEKRLFHEVGGFRGIDHVASGDDMLLMQKVARLHPDALGFLKNAEATVFTKAKPTVRDFTQQRLRWASKSSSYTEFFTVFQLVAVFAFCCNILLSLCLSMIFGLKFLILFAFQLAMKSVADFIFLKMMTRFFNRPELMRSFLTPQYFHVLYIVAIGFLANFKKTYSWKGRQVK